MAYERDEGVGSFLETVIGLGVASLLGYSWYKSRLGRVPDAFQKKVDKVADAVADVTSAVVGEAVGEETAKEAVSAGETAAELLSINPAVEDIKKVSVGISPTNVESIAETITYPSTVIKGTEDMKSLVYKYIINPNLNELRASGITLNYDVQTGELVLQQGRRVERLPVMQPFVPTGIRNISLSPTLERQFGLGGGFGSPFVRRGRNVYVSVPIRSNIFAGNRYALSLADTKEYKEIAQFISEQYNRYITEGLDRPLAIERTALDVYRHQKFKRLFKGMAQELGGLGRTERIHVSTLLNMGRAITQQGSSIRNIRQLKKTLQMAQAAADKIHGVSSGLIFAGHLGSSGEVILTEPSALLRSFADKDVFLQEFVYNLNRAVGGDLLASEVIGILMGIHAANIGGIAAPYYRVKGLEKGFVGNRFFLKNTFLYGGKSLQGLFRYIPFSKDVLHQTLRALPGQSAGGYILEGIYGGAFQKSPYTAVLPTVDTVTKNPFVKKALEFYFSDVDKTYDYLLHNTAVPYSFEGTAGYVWGSDVRNLTTSKYFTKSGKGLSFLETSIVSEKGKELVQLFEDGVRIDLERALGKNRTFIKVAEWLKGKEGRSVRITGNLGPIASTVIGGKPTAAGAIKLERGTVLHKIAYLKEDDAVVFTLSQDVSVRPGSVVLIGSKPHTAVNVVQKTGALNKEVKEAAKAAKAEIKFKAKEVLPEIKRRFEALKYSYAAERVRGKIQHSFRKLPHAKAIRRHLLNSLHTSTIKYQIETGGLRDFLVSGVRQALLDAGLPESTLGIYLDDIPKITTVVEKALSDVDSVIDIISAKPYLVTRGRLRKVGTYKNKAYKYLRSHLDEQFVKSIEELKNLQKVAWRSKADLMREEYGPVGAELWQGLQKMFTGRGGFVVYGTGAFTPSEMFVGLYAKYLEGLENLSKELGVKFKPTHAAEFLRRFNARVDSFLKKVEGPVDLAEIVQGFIAPEAAIANTSAERLSGFKKSWLFETFAAITGLDTGKIELDEGLAKRNWYKQLVNPFTIYLPVALRKNDTGLRKVLLEKSFNANDIALMRLAQRDDVLKTVERLYEQEEILEKRKLFMTYLSPFARTGGLPGNIVKASTSFSGVDLNKWRTFITRFRSSDVEGVLSLWSEMFGKGPIHIQLPMEVVATMETPAGITRIMPITEFLIPSLADLGITQKTLASGKLYSEGGLLHAAVDLMNYLKTTPAGEIVPDTLDKKVGNYLSRLADHAASMNQTLHNPRASGKFTRVWYTGMMPYVPGSIEELGSVEDLFAVRISEREAKLLLKKFVDPKELKNMNIDSLNEKLDEFYGGVVGRTPQIYGLSIMPLKVKVSRDLGYGNVAVPLPLAVLFKGDFDADSIAIIYEELENKHKPAFETARKSAFEKAMSWLEEFSGLDLSNLDEATRIKFLHEFSKQVYISRSYDKLTKIKPSGTEENDFRRFAELLEKIKEPNTQLTEKEYQEFDRLFGHFAGRSKLQTAVGKATNNVFDIIRGINRYGLKRLASEWEKSAKIVTKESFSKNIGIVLTHFTGSVIQSSIEKADVGVKGIRTRVAEVFMKYLDPTVDMSLEELDSLFTDLFNTPVAEIDEIYAALHGEQSIIGRVVDALKKQGIEVDKNLIDFKTQGSGAASTLGDVLGRMVGLDSKNLKSFFLHAFTEARQNILVVHQARASADNLQDALTKISKGRAVPGEVGAAMIAEGRRDLFELLRKTDNPNAFLDEMLNQGFEIEGEPVEIGSNIGAVQSAEREAAKREILREARRGDPARGKFGKLIRDMFYDVERGKFTGLGKVGIFALGLFGLGSLINIATGGVHEYEPEGVAGAVRYGPQIPPPPPNLGLGGPSGIVETPAHMSSAYTDADHRNMVYNIGGVHYAPPPSFDVDSRPDFNSAGALHTYSRRLAGNG